MKQRKHSLNVFSNVHIIMKAKNHLEKRDIFNVLRTYRNNVFSHKLMGTLNVLGTYFVR